MPLPSPDRLFTPRRPPRGREPEPKRDPDPPPRRPPRSRSRSPGRLRMPSWWRHLGLVWRHPFLLVIALLLSVTILPVLVLAVVPAWTSSFMLHYQAERAVSREPLPPLQQTWVPWNRIAPAAKLAVVAAEDQKFPEHFGFDVEAIEAAREHNRYSRRMRGASTISQQCAKNLFLWPERSWLRKGLEVGYTVLLETFWSKRRILEVYLNVAEFGPGVYGVEAASRKYFRKSAANLSYHEAALLAAVLPNPRRFSVASPSGYVWSRANWIDDQMRHLGTATIDGL